MRPLISIVVATKNEEKNIGRCLKSCLQLPQRIEVIVVDNYSTDKTTQIANSLGVKVYQKDPERSRQRNFGARKSRGRYLFFVDADMELNQAVLDKIIEIFKTDSRIVAIAVPEQSVGEGYWAQARSLERSFYFLNSLVEAVRVFRKEAFFKTGGYDEKLIAGEDWDLHQRVRNLGRIVKIKRPILHHEGKLILLNHLKKKYYYAKNIHFYAQKQPEKFHDQAGFPRIKIFLKNLPKLLTDPIHAPGVLVLKFLEYLVYLMAKIS